MSFGLNDEEWVYPEELPKGTCDCSMCKHCKDVWSGTDWYYCDYDAQLALRDAKTPKDVLEAFTGAWLDIDELAYCQHFQQD